MSHKRRSFCVCNTHKTHRRSLRPFDLSRRQVLVIPEVLRLVVSQVAAGEGVSRQQRDAHLQVWTDRTAGVLYAFVSHALLSSSPL